MGDTYLPKVRSTFPLESLSTSSKSDTARDRRVKGRRPYATRIKLTFGTSCVGSGDGDPLSETYERGDELWVHALMVEHKYALRGPRLCLDIDPRRPRRE